MAKTSASKAPAADGAGAAAEKAKPAVKKRGAAAAPKAPTSTASTPAVQAASVKAVASKAAPAAKPETAPVVAPAAATQAASAPAPAAATGKAATKKAATKKAAPRKTAAGKVKPEAKPEPDTKARKPKLVRDSFTMPETEYAALGEIKKACLKAGVEVKKSELLRAGVALLKRLDHAALNEVLGSLPSLRAGRPKKGK